MTDIPIQTQIDEIKVIGLGTRDWLERLGHTNKWPAEYVERKKQRLETLRAVHRTLEKAKAEMII